jgi:hypothetical protein
MVLKPEFDLTTVQSKALMAEICLNCIAVSALLSCRAVGSQPRRIRDRGAPACRGVRRVSNPSPEQWLCFLGQRTFNNLARRNEVKKCICRTLCPVLVTLRSPLWSHYVSFPNGTPSNQSKTKNNLVLDQLQPHDVQCFAPVVLPALSCICKAFTPSRSCIIVNEWALLGVCRYSSDLQDWPTAEA